MIFIPSFVFVEEEFTQYYLNERLSFSKHISQSASSLKDPLNVSPEAFDWRNQSAVTDVKNQVNDSIKIFLEKQIFDLGSMWFMLGI